MGIYLFIAAAVIIAALAIIFYFLNQKIKELKEGSRNDQSLVLLQNQISELTKAVDAKLTESHRAVQTQFGESSKIIKDVTEKLTKLDETGKQIVNFAGQLQSLEDILKNPKQRGILGEYYLETVLKNVLPPTAYQMQYKFKDGEIVDAAIFLGEQIIPIDSKFSLENYNRIVEERDPNEREKFEKLFKQDLKNRIDETAKYVRSEEGTTEYAFMFIPAEAIYYDLLVNQVGAVKINTRDLIEYANREKHVIIVSPTTFHVYLQLFAEGLRRMKISESVKDIIKRVGDLGKHLNAYDEYFIKLGNHLGTTVGAYNTASTELKKIDKDVVKITGGESQIEPLQIDKPRVE
ncbi:DNA recombination protein RmuC [Candidatus Falkowbacteria bacterium]|nr:DNA recombination protein RmuC [Candidatus Falkowbacteria bacterium]